jgi:hypothetical protein
MPVASMPAVDSILYALFDTTGATAGNYIASVKVIDSKGNTSNQIVGSVAVTP